MSKYGNENAAAGGRGRSTADRDRMYGGGGGFGGGGGDGRGTMGQQQDRRNMAAAMAAGNRAPGVRGPQPSQFDSRTFNPRYNQNLIASGPMTMHNMAALANTALPGGWARQALGIGPSYEGVSPRSATGYSYDGPNRFATNGSTLFPQNVPSIQAAGAPKPAQPPAPNPMMSPLTMQAGQFNIPGPSQYGVNLPSYGYFGKPPALQRPQSLIMGGI